MDDCTHPNLEISDLGALKGAFCPDCQVWDIAPKEANQ